jgi:hypothetical protein
MQHERVAILHLPLWSGAIDAFYNWKEINGGRTDPIDV